MPNTKLFCPSDLIQPSKLEHLVEEAYDLATDRLLFRYNFLRYEFEHPTGIIWARSYLHTPTRISIYPPSGVPLNDPVVIKVIAYARRRYQDVQHLTDGGYEPLKE